ncbi:hypothetical protein A2U01_0082573, partial [Trifolium medium]|nr:hypothetical protein [Trifolium medium]
KLGDPLRWSGFPLRPTPFLLVSTKVLGGSRSHIGEKLEDDASSGLPADGCRRKL